MELLNLIHVPHPTGDRAIGLYLGDLTQLEPEDFVDYLVVSAFPDDYIPTQGSLIGSLYRRGVDVAALASDKKVDLREAFSCWLSREIVPSQPGISFGQLLCFEPLHRGSPPEVVGDIFRSLAPFIGSKKESSTIALPIVASGDQGEDPVAMLVPLLEASIHWLRNGLPLKRIKLVIRRPNETVINAFEEMKTLNESIPNDSMPEFEYDAFVSYSHHDEDAVAQFVDAVNSQPSRKRLFVDRLSLSTGVAWQSTLFEATDRCRHVIAFLSPGYIASNVCKEEFNIGLFRSRESEHELLMPHLLHNASLPTYMKMLQYRDCREADVKKIRDAAKQFCSQMR